jgi:hypothetical protein
MEQGGRGRSEGARAVRRYQKIEKAQLKAWEEELSIRTEPKTFRSRVEEIHNSVGDPAFFVQGGLQFLRDAWIASPVATALSADVVRLWPADRPDFEIIVAGSPRLFEATEADMPERRRGDEYIRGTHRKDDPASEWRRRFDAIPAALETVIRKKIKKKYEPSISLVVFVNLGCYRAYVDEGIPVLRAGTSPAKGAFREVFAIWEGFLFSCWKDGQENTERWDTGEELRAYVDAPEIEKPIWDEVWSETE